MSDVSKVDWVTPGYKSIMSSGILMRSTGCIVNSI